MDIKLDVVPSVWSLSSPGWLLTLLLTCPLWQCPVAERGSGEVAMQSRQVCVQAGTQMPGRTAAPPEAIRAPAHGEGSPRGGRAPPFSLEEMEAKVPTQAGSQGVCTASAVPGKARGSSDCAFQAYELFKTDLGPLAL